MSSSGYSSSSSSSSSNNSGANPDYYDYCSEFNRSTWLENRKKVTGNDHLTYYDLYKDMKNLSNAFRKQCFTKRKDTIETQVEVQKSMADGKSRKSLQERLDADDTSWRRESSYVTAMREKKLLEDSCEQLKKRLVDKEIELRKTKADLVSFQASLSQKDIYIQHLVNQLNQSQDDYQQAMEKGKQDSLAYQKKIESMLCDSTLRFMEGYDIGRDTAMFLSAFGQSLDLKDPSKEIHGEEWVYVSTEEGK